MLERNGWRDLTAGQRVGILLGGIVQFTLLAAALWDIWHRPTKEINGDRRAWTAVAFINYVGPLAYFLFGRKNCC